MQQENDEKKCECKKQTWLSWSVLVCVLLLSACCIALSLKERGPLNTERLQGTIVILDENGDVIPYQDTTFTFYSRYAENVFRSETSRERNYYIDENGFGNSVFMRIPKFPATLFFHTWNGKYAAVVDLDVGEPTTGLVVTLRPRYSATGRLVDRSSRAPLANHEFRLFFQRSPSFDSSFFSRNFASVKTFETVYGETDADGYFTVDRLIPGLEYSLSTHQPREGGGYGNVTTPILSPEQYQELPFDLGDVSVTPFLSFMPGTRGVQIVEP
jgi:hypothetical protein